MTNRKASCSPAVCEKAGVANTNEALRQDMQEETAEELDGSQGHHAVLAAVGVILVAKRDALSIEGHDPMIGNGDPMSVAAKISQHLRGAAEGGLGIDNPVLAKQRSEKRREALRLFQVLDRSGANQLFFPISVPQAMDKLSPEDLAEGFNGQEERVQRMDPSLFVG